jgi:hypothetical protein
MNKLTRNIRASTKRGNLIPAIIVDAFGTGASARLSSNGAIYRNLPVIGGPANIDDKCYVDLTTPKPTIVMTGKTWATQEDIDNAMRRTRIGGEGGGEFDYDQIWLFKETAGAIGFSRNGDGFLSALAQAAKGDTIVVPNGVMNVGTCTIPQQVDIKGQGKRNTVIYGDVTMDICASLINLSIFGQVIGSSSGYTEILDCRVKNTSAYGVNQPSGGQMTIRGSHIQGTPSAVNNDGRVDMFHTTVYPYSFSGSVLVNTYSVTEFEEPECEEEVDSFIRNYYIGYWDIQLRYSLYSQLCVPDVPGGYVQGDLLSSEGILIHEALVEGHGTNSTSWYYSGLISSENYLFFSRNSSRGGGAAYNTIFASRINLDPISGYTLQEIELMPGWSIPDQTWGWAKPEAFTMVTEDIGFVIVYITSTNYYDMTAYMVNFSTETVTQIGKPKMGYDSGSPNFNMYASRSPSIATYFIPGLNDYRSVYINQIANVGFGPIVEAEYFIIDPAGNCTSVVQPFTPTFATDGSTTSAPGILCGNKLITGYGSQSTNTGNHRLEVHCLDLIANTVSVHTYVPEKLVLWPNNLRGGTSLYKRRTLCCILYLAR